MRKVLALFAFFVLLLPQFAQSGEGATQRFAQCLADRGAKMYSAWWCPHCLAQLRDFDTGWSAVNIKNNNKLGIEFPFLAECTDKLSGKFTAICPHDLRGVPTWEFADGTRAFGRQELELLSEKTQCVLPTSSK